MSIILESINLSIQRSVKVGEYQYNKVELGAVVNVKDEPPKYVIDKLYNYLDPQVDRLLKEELNAVSRNKQTIADEMEEDILISFD